MIKGIQLIGLHAGIYLGDKRKPRGIRFCSPSGFNPAEIDEYKSNSQQHQSNHSKSLVSMICQSMLQSLFVPAKHSAYIKL